MKKIILPILISLAISSNVFADSNGWKITVTSPDGKDFNFYSNVVPKGTVFVIEELQEQCPNSEYYYWKILLNYVFKDEAVAEQHIDTINISKDSSSVSFEDYERLNSKQ
ncbi:hypothetical protein QUF74_05485 [Candidatus Halobeggiatoa sp. HSG11]|nr:hypothetical protein [Candidatus Halobeggiatoa sp. HSG11]